MDEARFCPLLNIDKGKDLHDLMPDSELKINSLPECSGLVGELLLLDFGTLHAIFTRANASLLLA